RSNPTTIWRRIEGKHEIRRAKPETQTHVNDRHVTPFLHPRYHVSPLPRAARLRIEGKSVKSLPMEPGAYERLLSNDLRQAVEELAARGLLAKIEQADEAERAGILAEHFAKVLRRTLEGAASDED